MAGSGDEQPATLSLAGIFVLTDGVVRTADSGSQGTGGLDDFAEGTSVTVFAAAGSVAVIGNFGFSAYAETHCISEVAVDDLPKGETFHQAEVPHRRKAWLGGR